LIFPDVDLGIERLATGDGAEPNIAAGGFLELLRRLRLTILQDSVQLRVHFTCHPTRHHPIFQYPLYIEF
ncbi:hypothetical protein DFS34DRAFT_568691, partial [Phlyctochytrium arcticum]